MTNNLKEIEEALHTYGIRYNVIVESDNKEQIKVCFGKHYINIEPYIISSDVKHYRLYDSYADRNMRYVKVSSVIKYVTRTLDAYKQINDWCHIGVFSENINKKLHNMLDYSNHPSYDIIPCDLIATGTLSYFNFNVKKVIFNKPATIVYWGDGTKTVVKCQNGDTFNPETGIAMCFMKKAMGNKSNFNNVFKKFINSEEKKNEGSEESKT